MLDSAARLRGDPWLRESPAVRVAQRLADQPAQGRSLTPSRRRPVVAVALTCAAYVALGTVLWAAYGRLGPDMRANRPPLVNADAAPIKLESMQRAANEPEAVLPPASAAAAPDPGPQSETEAARSALPMLASDPAGAAPAPVESIGAAQPEPTPELRRPAADVVVAAVAPDPAAATPPPAAPDAGQAARRSLAVPAMPRPAGPITGEAARRTLAALEGLHGAGRDPSPGAPSEGSDAPSTSGVHDGLADARPPATLDARAEPPVTPAEPEAPSPVAASARLPTLKPSHAVTVVAAAMTASGERAGVATVPPPVPAFKPVRGALAAGSADPDGCDAAVVGPGPLPQNCGVRLAEARDQGVLASFFASLRDLFTSGAGPVVVAASEGRRDRSSDRSNASAGPASTGGPARATAGQADPSPGPTGGNSAAGAGAGNGGGNGGDTAGGDGSSGSDAAGSAGANGGGAGSQGGGSGSDTAGSAGASGGGAGSQGGGSNGGGGGDSNGGGGGGNGNGGGHGGGSGNGGGHGGGGGGHGGGGGGHGGGGGGGHGGGGGGGHGGGHGKG